MNYMVLKDRFCYVCGKPSYGRQCYECYSGNKNGSLSKLKIQQRHNRRYYRINKGGVETNDH